MTVNKTFLLLIVVVLLLLFSLLYWNGNSKTSMDGSAVINKSTSTPTPFLTPSIESKFMDPLQELLYKCSISMGISKVEISKNEVALSEVSRRARTLLDHVAFVLSQGTMLQSKNPCWYIKKITAKTVSKFNKPGKAYQNFYQMNHVSKGHVVCLPYFFLAGFPKSSTTTIHNMLSAHPGIVPPSEKEPHWWIRSVHLLFEDNYARETISQSFISYTRFFNSIASRVANSLHEEQITYDGSQSMLWDSGFFVDDQDYCATPAVLRYILPNAKFIVVMRNPATRLYSDFIYSCSNSYSKNIQQWPITLRRYSADLFHYKVKSLIEQFTNCTETASLFECANMRMYVDPLQEIEGCRIRLTVGLYVIHIIKWLQFFPLKNFLFIKMEDLHQNPKDVLSSITKFLEIDRGPESISNILKLHRNTHPSGVQPANPSTLALLEEFYRPYNEELAKLLGDSNFMWKNDFI